MLVRNFAIKKEIGFDFEGRSLAGCSHKIKVTISGTSNLQNLSVPRAVNFNEPFRIPVKWRPKSLKFV